jgi:hypothetical protein
MNVSKRKRNKKTIKKNRTLTFISKKAIKTWKIPNFCPTTEILLDMQSILDSGNPIQFNFSPIDLSQEVTSGTLTIKASLSKIYNLKRVRVQWAPNKSWSSKKDKMKVSKEVIKKKSKRTSEYNVYSHLVFGKFNYHRLNFYFNLPWLSLFSGFRIGF